MAHRHRARAKAKQKNNLALNFLTVLLTALFAAVAAVLILYLLWSMLARPSVSFISTSVTMEAGTRFNGWEVIEEVTNVPSGHIAVDTSALNTDVPGEYEVVYTIDAFPIAKETLAYLGLSFLSPAKKTQTVTVKVEDTTAPEMTVVESPYKVKRGTTVTAKELVVSLRDATDVSVAFSNGKTKVKCSEDGEREMTVVATDEAGNTAEKAVTLLVYGQDITPPVISGAEDVVLEVGESFDLMAGVTAEDSKDGKVSVKLLAGSVDTSASGSFSVTYTAVDAAGNEAVVTRNVAVYERTAGSGAGRFGLLWDNSGIADQPYLAAVNRVRNVVTIYAKDDEGNYAVPVQAFVCSIGEATPTGYFITSERYRWHELQEEMFGQYATRITGHILFHSVPYLVSEDPSSLEYEEYNKLGTFASLGCVRMCVADCKWVFENCPDGFPCVIFDDDLSDGPLGKPTALRIDEENEVLRGWDPTDPDPNNPWISELK